MTWKPRKARKCGTTGKRGYFDEIDAKIALGILRSSPMRETKESRVYACAFCRRWHLTSKDQKTERS